MENLISDSIKHLEEGLAPLIVRIKKFKSIPKNRHSKRELNLTIKHIEELPKYTEKELNIFVKELKQIPQHTEDELITFVEHLKTSPKKKEDQIREEVKALKHQPKRSKKDIWTLTHHLVSFPEQTEEQIDALMEYIKISRKKMEEEINDIIEEFKQLSLYSSAKTDTLLKYIEDKKLSEPTKKGLANFVKRIALIKHLNFIYRIKHVEKESKQQLIALTEIIRKRIPKCSMIVLFGSYARGTEVIYDETIENGSRVSFQSDFDIMIVLPKPASMAKAYQTEGLICSEIEAEYNELFKRKLHVAPPQFVVECEYSLCENLEEQRPFFIDIIKEGIFLYNDERITLPEPKELLYKIKKELAQEYFEHLYYADEFLEGGYIYLNRGNYVTGAFNAHQACEKYYRDLSMVFINYAPKLHDLEKLIERTRFFSTELLTVFPRGTDFENNTFKLIRDAYIDARYNTKFVVTKEELEYMLERTEALKEITYRICKEQIEYYNTQSQEE